MSSRIGWPKRSQNDQLPTINDGGSTTDPSGENNRLSIACRQQPVIQPGTNMSRNIIYNCTSGVYGAPQSESTDNAPILKRLLYRADAENFYETAQDSAQTRYDAEQPVTTNQKRDIRSPMGPQVENFKNQPVQEKTAPNAVNLAISWIDGRANNF